MDKHDNQPAGRNISLKTLMLSDQSKVDLIRKFQRMEENLECCASSYVRVCDQYKCLWRDVCLKTVPGAST